MKSRKRLYQNGIISPSKSPDMVKLNSRMKNQTYTQTLIGKDSLTKKNGRLILPRVKNTSVREDFKVIDSTDNMTAKTQLDTKSLREDTKTSTYSNKMNFVSRKI